MGRRSLSFIQVDLEHRKRQLVSSSIDLMDYEEEGLEQALALVNSAIDDIDGARKVIMNKIKEQHGK